MEMRIIINVIYSPGDKEVLGGECDAAAAATASATACNIEYPQADRHVYLTMNANNYILI